MKLFHKVEGGVAIVRDGIYLKQLDVYVRDDRVFIRIGSGYARVTARFGEAYGTVNPKVAVLELEAEGVKDERGELRYTGIDIPKFLKAS